MILSDRDIVKALDEGEITVDPFHPALLQPASIDVQLGGGFVLRDRDDRRIDVMGGSYLLLPGEFVLGSTLQSVEIGPSLAAKFEGRSTWGRIGLLAHLSAGFVDPGFKGNVTLELVNMSKEAIELVPGDRIGQLSFTRLSSPAANPYGSPGLGSHYQSQYGPTPAFRKEF